VTVNAEAPAHCTGSKSEAALNLLASWTATPGQQTAGELHDRR
jgi:hypothetical protein